MWKDTSDCQIGGVERYLLNDQNNHPWKKLDESEISASKKEAKPSLREKLLAARLAKGTKKEKILSHQYQEMMNKFGWSHEKMANEVELMKQQYEEKLKALEKSAKAGTLSRQNSNANVLSRQQSVDPQIGLNSSGSNTVLNAAKVK